MEKTMNTLRRLLCLAVVTLVAAFAVQAGSAHAQSTTANQPPPDDGTYSMQEIVDAGHGFFGKTTEGLAKAIESVFDKAGRPTAYIIGEEGAGAFIGGLRYGEGVLYPKAGGRYKVYWQGPSVGFDFGGDGSRTMILIYKMTAPGQIYSRFIGVQGSAYLVGGLGVSFQQNDQLTLAPIRTGVGARLGASIGYLKFTPEPTWNPF
ncbi:DUF1134 domain-containing protein [Kaustia mangrovi]|uniref:DUF1134 domain-containing protein n=2 Tax=Kaustia mangrovi TaxID=2593653 RepID=A0A7S8C8J2_9HYPH|nr:DUF1134 domain-containing protein [Kaustia mangrovi]